MNGSEMLLNNAERYGLLVASSVNGSDDDRSSIRQSRSNIGICGYHDIYDCTFISFTGQT